MSNYLYSSNLQKRFDKRELVSISQVEYTFQNIPLDGSQLHKGVVNLVINGYVSFDMFFQKEENGYYLYEDHSGVFEVRIRYNQVAQIIENIILCKKDVDLEIDFIKNGIENFDRRMLVDNVLTSEELRDVHPERLYSEEKLDDLIDTYEDRVDTASDWIDDYDTDSYTRSVMRSKLYEYSRCLNALRAERERRHNLSNFK
ncbi:MULTISPECIES: hypothetical protein [Bacteroides]|uniref:Uncharacterized protein n=2 Tax=Bacteroides fragilis TaxID=817 RepID=A0AAP9NEL2_BACFG|nr:MULTISPECIES: hypothetical protein [Bacteroides]EFR55533.1 hypothetical protein BFAG_04231 [Bacteroides fragilis 3_1_12]MBM6508746.1 hypothetical protein [Bacteroides fragilis]MBS5056611.1 hypothetical protein [Bacteroides sp.]QKH86023.1 hypothetical protein FOC69_17325 [Bacteroides fragilis]